MVPAVYFSGRLTRDASFRLLRALIFSGRLTRDASFRPLRAPQFEKKIWNGRGVGCLWKMHGWGSEIKSSIIFSRPLFYFFGNQSLAVLHS